MDSTASIEAGAGKTSVTEGGSLRFDNAIIRNSDLILTANDTMGMHQRDGGGTNCGDYGQYGQRTFIQVEDDASSLTLTARGQLGEEDNHLIVDIPEAVTLLVPEVGDMYVDSLELDPKVIRSGEEKGVYLTAGDLAYDLVQPIDHPDNPMVNEYYGTEVETGEPVNGDRLDHIKDELHSNALPFETNEKVAEAIVERKGTDWVDVLDEGVVKALIADELSNETILDLVSQTVIDSVLDGMHTEEAPVSDADRELASWIVDNNDGYEELAQRLADGETLTDEEITDILTNYAPDSESEEAWRDAQLSAILNTMDEYGDPIGVGALWEMLKASDDDGEKTALLTALLELQTADGSTVTSVNDLIGLLNELLTPEEKAAIQVQAVKDSQIPPEAAGGFSDPEPKPIHVEIGVSTGNTNLYNDGDIDIVVTGTSDLAAELIRSERGDVNIEVKDGNIQAAGDEEQNILGADVNLEASGDIGSASEPIKLQQRDNEPVVAAQVIEETTAGEQTGTIRRDENGNWVMDTAVSFDWVRKDIEDAAMRLDAESHTGDIDLEEIEGDTGLGIVDAAGNVTITTDGDVTDVRTDTEKNANAQNISSGGDTIVNAENGAVGTREDPIEVTVGGHMTVNDQDDIHVTSDVDLSITADTQDGVVNVHSDQDLTLDNTSAAAHGTGDMVIQEATADGNAEVNVSGSINGLTETDEDGNVTGTTPSVVTAGGDATVNAGGSISDTEVTAVNDAAVNADGNISDTEVTAGSDATANAHGNISDTDVSAGGDASVNADTDYNGTGSVTDVNVDANGDASVSAGENVSATNVTAGGDAVVSAYENVIAKTETDEDGNIISSTGNTVTAGGDATVIATNGEVNGTTVTAGDTVTVSAGESIRTDGEGTIFQGDNVDLRADTTGSGVYSVGSADDPVKVDTASGSSGTGSLSASGAEVFVDEQTGDLALESIEAIDGDAVITTPGSVTDANTGSDTAQNAIDKAQEASDAQNLADAAADTADVLDKAATRLEEEATQARAEADAAKAEAVQAQADAAAKDAAATAAETNAAQKEQDAQDVRDDISLIDSQIDAVRNDGSLTEEEKEAQIQVLEDQKTALEETLAEKEQIAQEAKEEAEALRKEADEAADEALDLTNIASNLDTAATAKENEATNARTDATNAAADAAAAQAAADAAQAAAEAALNDAQNNPATVETAGDLTIHAGGSVGATDKPLDTNVGGEVTIGASGDIALADHGDLHIHDLDADGNAAEDRDLVLGAVGDLTTDTVIAGSNVEIDSLTGSVGSDDKPLELDAEHLSGTIGGDANLVNHGDLTVDDLSVGGDLTLDVEGDLNGGDAAPGTANITAQNADIHADGNVGQSGDPLETAVDQISIDGEDVDIHSIHDVSIDEITGDDIHVSVDGEIYAGDKPINVIGDNLTLDTTGGIAEEDHPLYVYIPGELNVNNQTDDAYVINLYKKDSGGSGDKDSDGSGDKTGQNASGDNDMAAAQQVDWSELGDIVFRKDWTGAPAWICELTYTVSPDGVLRLTDENGQTMLLRDVKIAGRIAGIFALNDSLTGLCKEFRYLVLSEQTRRFFLDNGFTWIAFRVEDTVLLIDLTQLEETGEYIFALDPADSDGPSMTVRYDRTEILSIQDTEVSGLMAEELETAIFMIPAEDIL